MMSRLPVSSIASSSASASECADSEKLGADVSAEAFDHVVRPFMGFVQRPSSKSEGDSQKNISQSKVFFIEKVPLQKLLMNADTPFYVTSLSAVDARVKLYKSALAQCFPSSRVFYALKANWGIPIIRTIQENDEGFDIVSKGELDHLLSLGVEPSKICFAGVGKTPKEIEAALRANVGILNIEHLAELDLAFEFLQSFSSTTKFALRLNPCLEIETHPHLRTGALDSKFGMLAESVFEYLTSRAPLLRKKAASGKSLVESVCGIHVHVGSQLLSGKLFEKLVQSVAGFSTKLAKFGLVISHLDFGGGLGVGASGVPLSGIDVKEHVAGLGKALREACASNSILLQMWGPDFEKVQICLEPGRSIIASSTVFATRVLYTRENGADHRFAFVDGGMNDFPRPSIYGAKHEVLVALNASESGATGQFGQANTVRGGKGLQIVGPVCESGDVLLRDALVESVSVGDFLLFMEAGAYCRSMASQYNLRSLPQTFYVKDEQVIQS